MKVHAYSVANREGADLRAGIDLARALPLGERVKVVADHPIRLETIEPSEDSYRLNFVDLKHQGPGRASLDGELSDFEMDDADKFGYETAAIYLPNQLRFILQYNHYGPRAARIQTYLNWLVFRAGGGRGEGEGQGGISLVPILRQDARLRFDRARVVKKIEATVHIPSVLAHGEGELPSMNRLLETPVLGGAQKLKIEILAGRQSDEVLNLDSVRAFVGDVLRLGRDSAKVSVEVIDEGDGPRDIIDFFDARLEAEVQVHLTGRRYAIRDRWEALDRVRALWLDRRNL